jgi:2-C-methyl-D-erythritol 4-phosphate cytidylyltransferase
VIAAGAAGAPEGRAAAGEVQAAVVVACGGIGERFQDGGAGGYGIAEKQFAILKGKPVLAYTLDVLEKHPRISFSVLILPQSLLEKGEALIDGRLPEAPGAHYQKVRAILAGGQDRQASVEIGLTALADFGWQGPVLIQDGVRPCTPSEVYDRVIEGVIAKGNAVAAIPLVDTVKRADKDRIVQETVDRHGLWQIQTPQGFWMRDLTEACCEGRSRGLHVTDDAALIEALGRPVYLVEGDPANIKLTYPGDAVLLEALIQDELRL